MDEGSRQLSRHWSWTSVPVMQVCKINFNTVNMLLSDNTNSYAQRIGDAAFQ